MVTVATWNVENLYRPGSDYGPTTDAVYEAKLRSLATTIVAAGVDVLAVQEIGEPEPLRDLAGALPGAWHTAESSHHDGRGLRVGFVSRLALDVTADVADFAGLPPVQLDDAGTTASGLRRGALAVRVQTATGTGTALDLVTCHLKSKLLTFPGDRFSPRDEGERARYAAYALFQRAAEAVTVRDMADDLVAGEGKRRHVVVLGDFNDTTLAATTQILQGPPGSELGTPGADRPDQGDPWRLWNLAALYPPGQDYSRIHRGRRELVDHIFVSHALHDRVVNARAITDRGLPSITGVPAERRDAHDSDHAPVVAELAL